MPRGYRRIILVAVGCLILIGARPPNASSSRSQASQQIQPASTATVNYTAYSDKNSDRCYHAENHDSADLCAQWRAAIATEKAADFAWWSNIVAAGSALLTFASVVLVILALRQTERSLKQTTDANQIASNTAQRQLRAYLAVEPQGVNEVEDGFCRIPLDIKNWGQTPAYQIMVFSKFAIVENPRAFDPSQQGGIGIAGERSDPTLAPGSNHFLYCYLAHDFFAEYAAQIASKTMAVVHFGYVAYADVFGITRETRFAFYHWGEELSDLTSLRCAFGNSST